MKGTSRATGLGKKMDAKMKTERIFEVVMWFLIAAVGLFAAYVCFGILSSEASGQLKQYSVGGAIAGALVSWGVLTSVYLQLRRSTNEVDELRKRAEELQSKLIRGAPRQQGFDIEVAERQRIVLARPIHWLPKGGTIFELELPNKCMKGNDKFPATFRCYFVPILNGSEKQDQTPSEKEKFYEKELKGVKDASSLDNPVVNSYSSEMIRIGGEPSAVDSLKIIARQFLKIEIGPSPDTGELERNWWPIARDEFAGRITDVVVPPSLRVGQPLPITVLGWNFREGAICYVNGQKRETKINGESEAQVVLVDEDVKWPATIEIALENPGTDGVRSNAWPLAVRYSTNEEKLPFEKNGDNMETLENTKDEADQVIDAKTPQTDAPGAATIPREQSKVQVVFQQVSRMRVVSYHEELRTIYFFDFWDDVNDFVHSSDEFNQIIASTRFLS